MKVKLSIEKEYDVVTLMVDAKVRYWEDASVNGVEDELGDLIPCRSGESWRPTIELETGIITNWKQGTTADIHYKVCDAGTYKLIDAEDNLIKEVSGYVINMMAPKGNGYGDYIKMNVDENGQIDNWKIDLSDFDEAQD